LELEAPVAQIYLKARLGAPATKPGRYHTPLGVMRTLGGPPLLEATFIIKK
jgi:hypothetical protein